MDVPSIVSLRHINGFAEVVVTTVGARVLWLIETTELVCRYCTYQSKTTNARVGELILGII
jgi:hypothetical protein